MEQNIRKLIYLFLGVLFLGLGLLGLLLPVIPQVPFLAAGLFFVMRGSERLSGWIRNSEFYKNHLEERIRNNRTLQMLFAEKSSENEEKEQ